MSLYTYSDYYQISMNIVRIKCYHFVYLYIYICICIGISYVILYQKFKLHYIMIYPISSYYEKCIVSYYVITCSAISYPIKSYYIISNQIL